MAGPGVYRRRKEKKERQKLAEKLADLPWEIDPYTGRPTGRLPGEKGTTRTPEDVERWLRSASRTSPATPRLPARTSSITSAVTPAWMEQPWLNLWSTSKPGYARWSQASAPAYTNWQDWYAPTAQVEDRPEAAIINHLLPYLSSESDIQTMSRYLYTIGGGRTGPFADYLRAASIRTPALSSELAGSRGWEQWASSLTPTLPSNRPKVRKWWGERPDEGSGVTDWEEWWQGRPSGKWRNWFSSEGKLSKPPALSTYPGTEIPISGELPGAPALPDTYRSTLQSIERVLNKIPDQTAKDWARSVFNVYRDYTKARGMRGSEAQTYFDSQLSDLFSSIPEGAEPYAAIMQRLVSPTILRPEYEWYELPSEQRTSPENLRISQGLTSNPAWW